MKNDTTTQIIPQNISGKALDIEHYVVEDTIDEAYIMFDCACKKLLNPASWQSLTNMLSTKFTLFSEDKSDTKKLVCENDYLSIDIPGPGSTVGNGLDWVKVELIQQNMEADCDASIAMQLRASKNPLTKANNIAHFFNDDATSTFIIKRVGKKIIASYHGRNEMANTADVPLVDKVRNKLVATGAEAGLSDLYWEALIKGFLTTDKRGLGFY